MKHFLISILFLFLVGQVEAQNVSVVDTSSTFKLIYSDVKAGLKGLAEGLKVTTEHVYGVLVKQQIVKAVTFLILGLLSFVFLKNWIKAYKSEEEWWIQGTPSLYGNPSFLGIFRTLQMGAGIFLMLIFLGHIDSVITGFINPEYGAIKEIIDFIK